MEIFITPYMHGSGWNVFTVDEAPFVHPEVGSLVRKESDLGVFTSFVWGAVTDSALLLVDEQVLV